MKKSHFLSVIILVCLTLCFCEYFVYFLTQKTCDWPALTSSNSSHKLNALVLADTHLLGPYRGHWFDKLRREWQMSVAFLVANFYHNPDLVFFLGDVFDEGQWVNMKEYEEYEKRFRYLFPVARPYVIVGNHDVGFHYVMDQYRLKRFYKSFNLTSADILKVKGVSFVTLNSMAMEHDGCRFCQEAQNKINKIAANLNPQDRPVLMQHFPLYRKSDEMCQGDDAAPRNERENPFRPKFDCLSKEATTWLLNSLNPRLVLSGHTHHSCVVYHGSVPEYSVPSFSWRNRNNPSYMLLTISPDDYSVYKCYLPQESNIVRIYSCLGIFLLVIFSYHIYKVVITKRRVKML